MAGSERNIRIEIEAKTDKAISDIKRLNGQIDRLQKQNQNFKTTATNVKQMSRSFASLTTHVGKLAVIYGGFQGLQTTIRTFADFEQSITKLGAISGATGDELKLLEDKAMSLGESTIFTASQVAEGMNAMAMAGLNTTEQLKGIASVLDIASIGMIGLDESALIATRSMNAFGLEADSMGEISDTIVAGATNSAQTITQLGNAYEKVGAVATAFGTSMNETTSALMIMADAGRVGSEAGTQLKIVMSRLAGNKEATKYIDQLGISMYDANDKLLPFKDQLVLLQGKLKGLGEQARNIKLGEIFGEEGKASAIILMNNLDEYTAKLDILQNSFGVAQKKAKEMQDTLLGSYKELKSALEGLAIKIGKDLSPALRDIITDATVFIQTLDSDDINKFSESIANVITVIGEMGTVFVNIVGLMGKVTGAFSELTGYSSGLVMVMGALAIKFRKELLPIITGVAEGAVFLGATFTGLLLIIGGVFIALDRGTEQLKSFNESLNKTIAVTDSAGAMQTGYAEALGKGLITLESAKQGVIDLSDAYEEQGRRVRKLQAEKANLEDSTNWTGENANLIAAIDTEIDQLTGSMKSNKIIQDALVITGNKLTKEKNLLLKATRDEKIANDKLKESIIEVTGAEQEAVDKSMKALTSRRNSLENSLITMLGKETKYKNDILKLEEERLQIHKDYDNLRVTSKLAYDSKIANLKAQDLSTIQQYNDAQLRKDDILAKAQVALKKGNLDTYKAYYAEYLKLIAVGGATEISHTKKVMVWDEKSRTYKEETIKVVDVARQTVLAKRLADEKVAYNLDMQYIKDVRDKTLAANKAKLDSKIQELEVFKMQIELQKLSITLMDKLISQATGVKTATDLTEYNKMYDEINKQIDDLTRQKKDIQLGIDPTTINQDFNTVKSDIENNDITANVTTKVDESGVRELRMTVEEEEYLAQITADSNEAEATLTALQTKIKLPTIKPVDADTASALVKAQALHNDLSRRVDKYVYVHSIPVQGYNTGGMVTPLPRFADGGSLDNGIGHTTKQGKLGGYGGGDKIKALLEAGEFVIKKESVRALGLDRLNMINQGQLPRYQAGGSVSPMQRFSTGGPVSNVSNVTPNKQVDVNFNIGGQSFKMQSEESVATALADFLNRSTF